MKRLFGSGALCVTCLGLLTRPVPDPVMPWIGGSGVRALSVGGNYVSLSTDVSGLLWNPAAIAFAESSEVAVSADWLMHDIRGLFAGYKYEGLTQRIRLNNLGFVFTSPDPDYGAVSGLGFQNVYSLDGRWQFDTTFAAGHDLVSLHSLVSSSGSIDYWTVALGVMVTRHVSLGGSISYVHGSQKRTGEYRLTVNHAVVDSAADDQVNETKRRYQGYDARLGLLYEPNPYLRMGARAVVPANVWFTEDNISRFPTADSVSSSRRHGRLRTPFGGAAGIAAVLPLVTLTGEFRFRAPYNDPPDVAGADQWKIGGGGGMMLKPRYLPIEIRAGYSTDSDDPCVFMATFADSMGVGGESAGGEPGGWQQSITCGLGVRLSDNVSLDGSYVYSLWRKLIDDPQQVHAAHRVVAGLSVRW